jgi:hypothetical protein
MCFCFLQRQYIFFFFFVIIIIIIIIPCQPLIFVATVAELNSFSSGTSSLSSHPFQPKCAALLAETTPEKWLMTSKSNFSWKDHSDRDNDDIVKQEDEHVNWTVKTRNKGQMR